MPGVVAALGTVGVCGAVAAGGVVTAGVGASAGGVVAAGTVEAVTGATALPRLFLPLSVRAPIPKPAATPIATRKTVAAISVHRQLGARRYCSLSRRPQVTQKR